MKPEGKAIAIAVVGWLASYFVLSSYGVEPSAAAAFAMGLAWAVVGEIIAQRG